MNTKSSGIKIAFPRFAHYNAPIKYALEQGTGVTCLLQPEITRRTVEIGTKYSPDYVCAPFKVLLGSMIEALEAGANTLFMTHGYCKLGYYGELEEQILRDLGYEFRFINLADYTTGRPRDYLKALKELDPKANYAKFLLAGRDAIQMAEYIDDITSQYFGNCGFAEDRSEYRKIYRRFLHHTESVKSRREMDRLYQQTHQQLDQIPLDKPAHPLRVGIVGEFFTVMDPASNLEIEQHLADMGVEVHRWMNVRNRMFHYPGEKNLNVKIRDLCTYEMGPTSTGNIWAAREYAEQHYDGIVHVKGASCTPEIDIMPVLQNISRDYKIPVLFLTYDSQTSDVGIMTRLEAFYDMIEMRKKVYK